MKVVTHLELDDLTGSLRHWAYNAMDCCVTREVHDNADKVMTDAHRRIYAFEHRQQAAALAMTTRGVLIDGERRNQAIRDFEKEEHNAQTEAADISSDVWHDRELRVGRCGDSQNHSWPRGMAHSDAVCGRCGKSRLRPKPLNTQSPPQVAKLLYEGFRLKVRRDRATGKPTTDDDALEAIKRTAKIERVKTVCSLILKARKARKQIGYARSGVGPGDYRMRSFFNPGAAETGRWSSQALSRRLKTGWNLQQISERLKGIIVADPGLEFWYTDYKQAESSVVAYDANDIAYIDAHQSADVHTLVCKTVGDIAWPGRFTWTGDWAEDKKIAEQKTHFDPHHSYRDYMKRIQHGGNMGRTPAGVARQMGIPLEHAVKIYAVIYGGTDKEGTLHRGLFPMIKARHGQIHTEIQSTRKLTSVLGRERTFLGRVWEDDTLREALGQLEQSPVVDVLSLALMRIFEWGDTRCNIYDAPHPSQPNKVWLLGQIHDALLGLYRPGDVATLREVANLMTIPIIWPSGKSLTLEVEMKIGRSWDKEGMKEWTV